MVFGKLKKMIASRVCSRRIEKDKSDGLFNWDNCDFETNGESFFVRAFCVNWKLMLDIGANKGEYSNLVLQYNPACRAICFEPNQDLLNILHADPRLEVENFAVGDVNGFVELNINIQDSTQSSIYRNSDDTVSHQVKQISIDSYLAEQAMDYVDFIKIDTEGHEIKVLEGMRKSIEERRIGVIQFEYGGTYKDAGVKLLDAYNLLSDHYIVCHLLPSGLLPLRYTDELETYRYSNWIAISRDFAK